MADNNGGRLASLLLCGAENAQTSETLMQMLGLKSFRDLRKMVEAARLRGELILSTRGSGGGYFLPDEGEKGDREIEDFVRMLQSEAISLMTITAATRKAGKARNGGAA